MPDESPTGPTSSSSTPRRWIRRGFVAAAVLVLLYLGTAFVLSRFLDPEELATWMEPRLEQALSRDVDVGRVEVGFLPLGVRLQDLTVADPTGLAPNLAHLGSLELQVAILPLFRREVRVSRLDLHGLQANLRVGPEGGSNFGDLSARGMEETREGEDAPQAPFTLDLRSIRLEDATLSYSSLSDSLVARAEALRIQARARQDAQGSWSFQGSSRTDLTAQPGGTGPLVQDLPLELEFEVEADRDFQELRVRTGDLRLAGLDLELTGEVDHLQDPVRVLHLEFQGHDLSLSDLVAVLPDSLRRALPLEARGAMTVDLTVEGGMGPERMPSVTGGMLLSRGHLALNGEPLARELTVDLDLVPERTVEARVRASVLDGPFELEGRIGLADDVGMDLEVRTTPNLRGLTPFLQLPEGSRTTGEVAIQLRVRGPVGGLSTVRRGLRLYGEIRPRGVTVTHPALASPVAFGDGTVRLSETRASIQDLPVSLGGDELSLSAEIPDVTAFLDAKETPRLEGSIRGGRLDLTRLTSAPRPDTALSYGKVAFAKVGERSVGGRTVQEAARELGLRRPGVFPVAGSLLVRLDTVRDARGRWENVGGRVEFGPDFLRLSEATLRRYGGTLETTGNLTLSADTAAPFSFNLQVRELDAGTFLSETTPLGRVVRGRISLSLDVVGTLDGFLLPDRPTLVGSGSFTLQEGGLTSIPLTRTLADFLGLESLREPAVQSWAAAFVLEDGQLLLDQSTVRGAPGSPRVGGRVGLNGDLDLETVFHLPPERLESSALERLGVAGEIAADVARRPEVVQAVLHIVGSVLDPSIQADPRATAVTLREAVQEEVQGQMEEAVDSQKAQVQRKIEEQKEELRERATGFLRGLLRRGDTAVTRPDSVPSDSILSDSLPADSLLPDSLKKDTVPPDTVNPDTTALVGAKATGASGT